jgi:eukaryotic-like serine/threonine-protein kinase
MENGVPAGAEAAGILEAGTRVGKYEIRRLIGLGSMSAIYAGERPDTGRLVALKVLSPKRAAVAAARVRFLTEAKLTARVRHPHVVEVIEVGEDQERSYLAMEMLEGEDLASRLRHSTSLPADETADILVPVCEAVAAAHESGVVHRDLKPANIFLSVRNEKVHPVVLDFGVANDTEDYAEAVAGPHLVFGTPYYLSPEQVSDHRAASPASDQWALGVILYECLTGARPYDGDSLEDVFAAIRAGRAKMPSERRSGIPSELGQIVMRAMSSDPKARFASVSELAQALRPFRSVVGEARPPRRRPPSSPSIMAEASTQSPFSRTLTPEPDVLDGLWFEPDPTEETEVDVPLPPASLSSVPPWNHPPSGQLPSGAALVAKGERLSASGAEPTFASRTAAGWGSFANSKVLGRGRIVAVAAGALGGLALLFLITHIGSAHRAGSREPAMATQRAIEPIVPAPTKEAALTNQPSVVPVNEPPPVAQPAAATAPSAATEPAMVKEPEPMKEPEPTKEPVAAKEPVTAKEPVAAKEPVTAKKPVAAKELTAVKVPLLVKTPVATKDRAGMEPVAKQVTPTALRSPKTERHDRGVAAPNAAQNATGSVTRDAAEKPRARPSTDVRLHNGVPLLD